MLPPRLLQPPPGPGRPPTSSAWAGMGIPDTRSCAGPCISTATSPSSRQNSHPLPGGFSEPPGAPAPDTPALLAPSLFEVLRWRQAEGPFSGATISSVEPEPQTTAYLHLILPWTQEPPWAPGGAGRQQAGTD